MRLSTPLGGALVVRLRIEYDFGLQFAGIKSGGLIRTTGENVKVSFDLQTQINAIII